MFRFSDTSLMPPKTPACASTVSAMQYYSKATAKPLIDAAD
jgi:hypothetical protein